MKRQSESKKEVMAELMTGYEERQAERERIRALYRANSSPRGPKSRPFRLIDYVGDHMSASILKKAQIAKISIEREIEIGRQSERDLIRGAEKEARENRQKRGE